MLLQCQKYSRQNAAGSGGITSFIPADEAIDAMKSVGDRLPCTLKETAEGGLAQTPTALAWAQAYFAADGKI